MAVTPGTVVAVHSMQAPHGPKHNSAGNPFKACIVDATFTGTYASANDASISSLTTAIANKLRNGKTVTLVDVAAIAPGALSSGVLCGAKDAAVSGSAATMILTQADGTTRLADGAVTVSEPVSFLVQYIES